MSLEPLKDLAVLSPLGTFTVAVISAILAFRAIGAQRRNMRQQVARNLFADYIKKSIDFPQFASPEIAHLKTDTKMDLININFDSMAEFQNIHPEIEQYEWFLSLLIFSLNEILSMKPDRKKEAFWKKIALRHLSYHRSYFIWRLQLQRKGTDPRDKNQEKEIWFLQLGDEFQQIMKKVLAPHLDGRPATSKRKQA